MTVVRTRGVIGKLEELRERLTIARLAVSVPVPV